MDEFWLLAVPLAPLAAAIISLIPGRPLEGKEGIAGALSAGLAFFFLLFLSGSASGVQTTWVETAGLKLTIGIQLDGLAWFMAMLVAGIGLLVNVYAIGYMAGEQDQGRFFATFSFFLSAMLTLVLADSFLLLFAAWEAVGIASFLLIGFWYRLEAARAAAFKAFVVTRCGDVGLLMAWLLALLLVGTTEIDVLLRAVDEGTIPAATLAILGFLFFTGAVGKSAQLPLTAWLPEAMVGPTPVSALIHSATMVAAGVYLLLRLFPLFTAAPYALTLILGVGAITALLAALIATVQFDLKRVLAWSTVSQLGEMTMAVGLAGPLAAAFHLGTHAAFKSTLFLAAGAVDHATGNRNLRRVGQLGRKMPVTALVFCGGALALAGLPPLSGFWSEEIILAVAVSSSPVFGLLLISVIFLAGVYISRASFTVFLAWPGSPALEARDPATSIKCSMVLLGLAALALGWLLTSRLETVLPFSRSKEIGWTWRAAAMLASVTGLGFGAWRAWKAGPVPALGPWPERFENALYAATVAPAKFALACADGLERIERWFDRGARRLGDAAFGLANAGERAEAGLDRVGRTLAETIMALGMASDVTERQGFSANLDRVAGSLALAAGQLRALQSGRLYLYTLGVFIWVVAAALLGFLLWN